MKPAVSAKRIFSMTNLINKIITFHEYSTYIKFQLESYEKSIKKARTKQEGLLKDLVITTETAISNSS